MSITLEFDGVVDSWTTPDHAHCALTVRIGGTDVLAALGEQVLDLEDPITAAVTLGTDAPIGGQLHFDDGYSGGCGTCFEPAVFEVDRTNLLNLLSGHDGQHVTLTVTLAGHVRPPERIVPVEWAHHVEYDGTRFKPLDTIELPEGEAQRLVKAGMVTRDSAAKAGLKVPA